MINKKISTQLIDDTSILQFPLSVDTDTSLSLAIFYMNLMKVEAAGVVDGDNNFVGSVTYKEVIDSLHDQSFEDDEKCTCDIMRSPNISVYIDDTIEQAQIMMRLHKIDWLPVFNFETQDFVGLVCRKDIEKLYANVIPFPKRKSYTAKAA